MSPMIEAKQAYEDRQRLYERGAVRSKLVAALNALDLIMTSNLACLTSEEKGVLSGALLDLRILEGEIWREEKDKS